MQISLPRKVPLGVIFRIVQNYFVQTLSSKSERKREAALRLQNILLDYLEKDLFPIFEAYRNVDIIDKTDKHIPRIVWLFWWQGEDSLPEIQRLCIQRFRSLSGFDVRLISKNNIKEYIDISDEIYLFEKKLIFIQHLSDVVRFRLLRKYGGFYCDSSILLVDDSYFDYIVSEYVFFSNKFSSYDCAQNVMHGKCSTYFWATFPDNPFFAYLDDGLTYFLSKHKGIIDYTQSDYTIAVGYRKLSFIRELIDALPPNNQNSWWLNDNLLTEYNENEWNDKIKTTHFFKVSSQQIGKVKHKTSIDRTYYDYVVSSFMDGGEKTEGEARDE